MGGGVGFVRAQGGDLMGPGRLSREVGHAIFWVLLVEKFTSANKLRAFPILAGMIFSVAVDTMGGMISIALDGEVWACAGTACVSRFSAVAGDMSISLTLSAPNGFSFVLSDSDALVLDTDSFP